MSLAALDKTTMELTQEHLNFEELSRQLIGLTVLKVEYSEINYDETNPEPNYQTHFKNLDSVDFSILIHTNNGKLVEIYWDGQFYQFGIGIRINQISNFSGSIKWDVSGGNLWKKFIDATISEIQIGWETVTNNVQKDKNIVRFVYPQAVKISFSNEQNIFISAAGFLNQGDNKVFGMLDNLTVTDNEELARQVKMIL